MMSELLTFSLSVFMGFFAIMNPIANTPVFMGLILAIIGTGMVIAGIKIAYGL